MKDLGQTRHPKSQDSPPMLPPFSCLSKCHPCGTQVVGHVLPCELGVPWAQHGPWLRPSAVTQPKIPPGVFLCWEQDQAEPSWPWRGTKTAQALPHPRVELGGWGSRAWWHRGKTDSLESCFLGQPFPVGWEGSQPCEPGQHRDAASSQLFTNTMRFCQ